MDRWHSHTRHCAACAGALRGLRRWRPFVVSLPWLALLGIAWWHTLPVLIGGLAVACAAVLLAQRFDRWERLLLAGEGHPPRNRPD
jgi:acyl-CoA synthetase (AMP-forming)/AMP-acid ligase II